MKLKLTLVALALIAFGTSNAQINLPAPSPAGSVMSKVGLADVQVDYSRPKMKGRKIFGEGSDFLVPFGQVWRTGANSGTIVTTSADLSVAGNTLPAGEYMLITIPGAESWTVIFYKDKSIGGNMGAYKQENDQLRVDVKSSKLTEAVEALTFNISDLSADGKSGSIELSWENTAVKVPMTHEFDAIVMKEIEAGTKVNAGNYLAAANYYYATDRDLDQAIQWMDLYLADNGNQFWNIFLKAEIQAKNGDKKGARATSEKSLELAKNAEGGDFGYIKRNEDFIASLK
jgi:hypothetical protein